MTNIYAANAQWRSRPDDQRFTSLDELQDFVSATRDSARSRVLPLRALDADPDGQEIVISGFGKEATTSHWSFGQLVDRIKPEGSRGVHGYLRSLPPQLTAANLGFGLKFGPRASEDIQLYWGDTAAPQVRAATGPKYGRIFDADLVRQVRQLNESGRWTVPTPFKTAGQDFSGEPLVVTKENTTLYASDRDVWVFLVDENNPITLGDQTYFRGFYTSNSEVGDAKFNLSTFLYSVVCANRIIWNATEVEQISIRHTSGAPERFLEEVGPALKAIADSSPQPIVNAVKAAQDTRVARTIEEADAYLQKKLGVSPLQSSVALSLAAKGGDTGSSGDPLNLWDVIQGGTKAAQAIGRTDDRFADEKLWSSLLTEAKAGRTIVEGTATTVAVERLN